MTEHTHPLTQGQWQTWASLEIAEALDASRRGSKAHSDLRLAGRALDRDNDPAQARWHLTMALPRVTSEEVAGHLADALVYLGAAALPIRPGTLRQAVEREEAPRRDRHALPGVTKRP